ncbi:MAG: hypothetical protein HQM13_05815 [SAR324 cluster bacterium]|nr:hypothetical protein [SAR324 cluster bacterium]
MMPNLSLQVGGILSVLFLLISCSNAPEFTPRAEQETLRGDIQSMREQWRTEKCPGNAKRSQCEDFIQSGLRHCMNKNPSQKTRCIYNELYCTLFGGKACRF